MAWWLLLHFKIQPLQSLNAASVHLDSGWLSDSLRETLMSHMVQEEFPCACGEGHWGRVIDDSPVSSPLCCQPRFARLKDDWRRDSSTRLSAEREDTQTMSQAIAWFTPPWRSNAQYSLSHINTYTSSSSGVTHHPSHTVCSAFNSHLNSSKVVNWEVGCTVFLKSLSHHSLQQRCVRLQGSCFMHKSKQQC